MKHAIRKIEEAIKSLYNIDLGHNAANFLVRRPLQASLNVEREVQGSLYLVPEGEDLSIGIYLHPKVREELSDFRRWEKNYWTHEQRQAFVVATEEVSHFLYLLFHSNRGRSVSQFELELQGEIDKFLLLFFLQNETAAPEKFEQLFESIFSNYRWAKGLSEEEKERYEQAHQYAKKFTLGLRHQLKTQDGVLEAVKFLRFYYRLSSAEKVSYLHK